LERILAEIGVDRDAHLWMRQQQVKRLPNICAEPLAKAHDPKFVGCRRLNKFQLRLRMEFQPH
jgi:hypothetical protein